MHYSQYPYQLMQGLIPDLPDIYPRYPHVQLPANLEGYSNLVVAHALHVLQQRTTDNVGLWLFNVVMEHQLNNMAFERYIMTTADILLYRFVKAQLQNTTESQLAKECEGAASVAIDIVAASLVSQHPAGVSLQNLANQNQGVTMRLQQAVRLMETIRPEIQQMEQALRERAARDAQVGMSSTTGRAGGGFGENLFDSRPAQAAGGLWDNMDTTPDLFSTSKISQVSDDYLSSPIAKPAAADEWTAEVSSVKGSVEPILPANKKPLSASLHVLYPPQQPYPLLYNPRTQTLCYTRYQNGYVEELLEVPMDVQAHQLTTAMPDSTPLRPIKRPDAPLTEEALHRSLDTAGRFNMGFIDEEELVMEFKDGVLNISSDNVIAATNFSYLRFEVESELAQLTTTADINDEDISVIVYSGYLTDVLRVTPAETTAIKALQKILDEFTGNRLRELAKALDHMRRDVLSPAVWRYIDDRMTDRFSEALRFSMNYRKNWLTSFTECYTDMCKLLEKEFSDNYTKILERHASDIMDNALDGIDDEKEEMFMFRTYLTVARVNYFASDLPFDFNNKAGFGAVSAGKNPALYATLRSLMELNPAPDERKQDYYVETKDGALFRVRGGWLTTDETLLIHPEHLK